MYKVAYCFGFRRSNEDEFGLNWEILIVVEFFGFIMWFDWMQQNEKTIKILDMEELGQSRNNENVNRL